jgi:hypothetical protein
VLQKCVCCWFARTRTCREKVTIASRKRYVLLEGDGPLVTDISFDAHAHAGIGEMMSHRRRNVSGHSPTFRSATFTVLADNFVARNIAFMVSKLSIHIIAHVRMYADRCFFHGMAGANNRPTQAASRLAHVR